MSKAIEAYENKDSKDTIIDHLDKENGNIRPKYFTKHQIFPSQEMFVPPDQMLHYYIASNHFFKMISKPINKACFIKEISDPSEAIESITYVQNKTLEEAFENQKRRFKEEGKVDAYGNVRETLLFHGTSEESIENIIDVNFCVDFKPSVVDGTSRKKAMMFGKGIYFSELPGVCLNYGAKILLCKVLTGKCENFNPCGNYPPPIPDCFDSREIVRNGARIVHVVKNPAQILPYCIINLKQGVLKLDRTQS